MSRITSELLERLRQADHSIRILGVIGVDSGWDEVAEIVSDRLLASDSLCFSVLCDADNSLFAKSLLTDTEFATDRMSFKQLLFRRDLVSKRLPMRIQERARASAAAFSDRVVIEISHLEIPLYVIEVDGDLFTLRWLDDFAEQYTKVEPGSEEHKRISRFVDRFFDPAQGRKYSAPPSDETLELYDHERIPRGIFPRRSFYDTDYSQLVIWGLVFDRNGRMLIHRRSDNAKDNRSMWDKSVGGHVDYELDVDTSRAMSRELIEELFTDEIRSAVAASTEEITAWTVNDQDLIYLGEWRAERRGEAPFQEIANYGKEWVFFRLRDSQQLYSPRTMPDGQVRRLRVIADVYLFVAGPSLSPKSLGDLKNSTFKLLTLGELKTAMDIAIRGDEVTDFDKTREVPLFSPDLTNIMTGSLRDTLEIFAQHIKAFISRP